MTALVVGVVGAAAVVGVLAMPSSPPEHDDTIAAATARRDQPEEPRIVDDGTWTDDDIAYCRQQARTAASAAEERKHLAVSAGRVGLGSPGSDMVERSAHLLCSASRKPSHLCETYWRKQFIEAVKAYAVSFRDVSQQSYWSDYEVGRRAKEATGDTDWQSIADDIRQTTHEMAEMHAAIVAAFRSLIADGIIDPDDFGIFFGLGIPPEVAALIGDARRVKRVCG